MGQLGSEIGQDQATPKIVRSLATKHIVQIACGQYHSLALTNSGDLYAWGSNSYGQLGLGTTTEKVSKPTLVKTLQGVPIAFIMCGGSHSFAVTKSGAVFGWGKNTFGQLGLNHAESRSFPTQLKTLRTIGVRCIACGDDFSVFLTHEGGVLTCGAGSFGQLGHGNCNNEILPRMVTELMGSTVTQISCGKRHVFALVPSRGRVYGFGIGGSGQLGNRNNSNASLPTVIVGPWVAPNGSTLVDSSSMFHVTHDKELIIKRIFCGGDRCFAIAIDRASGIQPDDLRIHPPTTQICQLTLAMTETFKNTPATETVDLELLSAVEIVFRSAACLNGSFLLPGDEHFCCTSKRNGVDLETAMAAFENIRKTENESIKELVWESITSELITNFPSPPPDVEAIRLFLVLPLYHEFINCKNYAKLHSPFR